MLGWLDRIAKGIESLADSIISGIVDGIKAIFVPSEDFLTEKVETIRAEFAFVDSIMQIGESVQGVFASVGGGTVPRIEVDFSGAGKRYDYGGNAVVLDMSWYAKYKPSVDSILSAMIWLFFIWRLFVHAPGIISGASGLADYDSKMTDIKNGFKVGKRR